jgi:hypothetical protein
MRTVDEIYSELDDLSMEIYMLEQEIRNEKHINIEKCMRSPLDTDYIQALMMKMNKKIIQRDTLNWVTSNS